MNRRDIAAYTCMGFATACLIWASALWWNNDHLTGLQAFKEYWHLYAGAIVLAVLGAIVVRR